jgi:DNA-binding LytR/AlgR family response regulator
MKLWRRRKDEELDAEIRSHLDAAIRDRLARGEAPDEARANALREFGNVGLVKEVTREMWGWAWLERLGQDLRFGLRVLRKQPGFSLVVMLTLALGIGVNTALFTVFNAIALRPLPVKEPDRIVKVYRKDLGQSARVVSGSASMFSYPEYIGYRDNVRSFSGLTAYYAGKAPLTMGEAEEIRGVLVAGNYFSVLGAEMAVSRGFAPEEGQTPGAAPVVVLSHRFWQRRFGSDASLVGKTVTLNRQPFTVIGVAAPGFHGAELEAHELWAPLTMQLQVMPGSDFLYKRNLSWLEVVGRLQPGVSQAQAQAELTFLAAILRGFEDVRLIGEAENGAEAIEIIEREKPDLALLDLQMPEIDGLGVVRLLKKSRMPLIAFVTAYDEYAVRAFELNAVDYLLKPVEKARLRDALNRAQDRLERAELRIEAAARLDAAASDEEATKPALLERIPVRQKDEIVIVPVKEIASIVAEGEILRLTTTNNETFTIAYRLKDLEARLDPAQFVRLGRGALANLEMLRRVSAMPGGTYVATLSNGQQLGISRLQGRILREHLLKL